MTEIEKIWEWLEDVKDPEVPVLSVVDLGVVRSVELIDGEYLIKITPTYSGCPAMQVIEDDVRKKNERGRFPKCKSGNCTFTSMDNRLAF